jgi:formyltetrahydrofolate deformylase
MNKNRHILTIQCQDQPGIVKAATEAIYSNGGNIIESAQFSHDPTETFCLRMEVDIPSTQANPFSHALREQLSRFDPMISVRAFEQRRKVVLMVSKADHCLLDILYHWAADELPVDIVAVVANHRILEPLAESYGIPFHLLQITPENKPEQEAILHSIVSESGGDFIVLARYMQILSDDFCSRYPGRIINIHHSFLPGFKGARPYHQAYERGVKLIGATAHYVTSDLDEGPIIEQDVVRVSHRLDGDDLVKIGRDVERRVLTRAIRLHAEDRVMLTGTRTVVFD